MEELKEKVLKLGLAVYRVTKLYPGGEVLIFQTRELANQILSDLVSDQKLKAAKKVEIILRYLQIARVQDWIKDVNFDILIRGYDELLIELRQRKDKKLKKESKVFKKEEINILTQRQRKILEYIKEVKETQLKELSVLIPKISPRTIRNDLNNMVKKRFLIREGDKRTSVYRINREIDKEI